MVTISVPMFIIYALAAFILGLATATGLMFKK